MIGDLHHHRSIRLVGYDYTQPGAYFVTIVAKERNPLFGEIIDSDVRFSKIGEMVRQEWLRLERRFPHVELDEFIIMPNHIHGIIILNESRRGSGDALASAANREIPRAPTGERFGAPIPGSIPTIMRSFKSSTTHSFHRMIGNSTPRLWQRNYYEHVIRDERELERIREYIQANPYHWDGRRGISRVGARGFSRLAALARASPEPLPANHLIHQYPIRHQQQSRSSNCIRRNKFYI